jgi:surfeit locus 1 family protein
VKKAWFYYLFSVVLCLSFFSLGRWQLARAEWKQEKLDAVAAVLKNKTPEPLAAVSKQNATDLQWAAGRGQFLSVPALYLDNQRRENQVGVEVYRVFQPENGKALLVNLGWLVVPANRIMPNTEKIIGTYQLNGLLVPPSSPGIAMGPAHVKTNQDYWLLTRMQLDDLSKDLNIPLSARVLRLNPELPLGYARNLDVLPNTLPPEKHKGYALQWFGLCAATFIITCLLSFRRKETKK